MRRILSALLICVLIICTLSACSELKKELTVSQTVSSNTSEEMPATEHSDDVSEDKEEEIVITAEYSPEGFTANGDNYIIYSVPEEELSRILFKTNIAVGNVRFLAIEWGEDFADSGEYIVTEVLKTIDVLAPTEIFVADTYFIDVAPARAISYLDKDGKTRYFGISTSAVDGSLIFSEITVIE